MRKGFTLIEILVVVSIIGLLSSIVSVFAQDSRKKANVAAGQLFSSQMANALGTQTIAEWDFDDYAASRTAGIVGDTSGNNITGSVTNAAWTTGINGGAMYFDGAVSNGYVSGTGIATVGGGSNITVSAWVNPTNTTGTKTVFTHGSALGGCFGYGLELRGGVLSARNNGTSRTIGSQAVSELAWQHVAISYDSATGRVTGYINGKSVGTVGLTTAACATQNWTIGTNSADSITNTFIGKIDEVRVYSETLSSAQIEKLYAQSAKKILASK